MTKGSEKRGERFKFMHSSINKSALIIGCLVFCFLIAAHPQDRVEKYHQNRTPTRCGYWCGRAIRRRFWTGCWFRP